MPGQHRPHAVADNPQASTEPTDESRVELPPAQPTADKGPGKPSELGRRSWLAVLKRTFKE
ncbi:MAG: ribonuclease BN, partial [Actinobacteria bacterium]